MLIYLGGLGCVLSMIFFRSWFTLPLAHMSTEFDIALDPIRVKQRNVKGWFADFLYYGWPGFYPREILWNSVVAIDYEEAGFGQLTPLPDTMFKSGSMIDNILRNVAALVDTYVESNGRATYVVLRTRYDKAFGHGLKIRLADLNKDQRKDLFDAVHKWGSHAQIDERVEHVLLNRELVSC
jgi:hypothetical protein